MASPAISGLRGRPRGPQTWFGAGNREAVQLVMQRRAVGAAQLGAAGWDPAEGREILGVYAGF